MPPPPPLSVNATLLLLGVGFIAGCINSVAGGGSFLTLPILMFTGLDAKIASSTSSMSVWPGNLAGLIAYRSEYRALRQPLRLFLTICVVGSLIGSFLFLYSSAKFFEQLLPFLLLLATVLFAFGERITAYFITPKAGEPTVLPRPYIVLLMTGIAVYGGYFGGGMGIMTLAMLALMGMTDIHEMNALKSLLVMVINAICNVIFMIQGLIDWPRCLALMVGCTLGAYVAGRIARKIDRKKVKMGVIVLGACMTVYYFIRLYK